MTEDRNKAGEPRPFLEVRGLRKDFGGVRALKDIDLQVYPGEIHGLVGANGAGKSTLIKILAGLQSSDAGTVLIDGEPVNIQDSQRADRLGLQFIHQELNLVPKFNSLQNITLGLPKKTRFGLVDWRAERLQVAAVTERLGMNFSLNVPVENLSVANQWLVSMGRALVRKARLIAMDEPTASLSPVESERLFRVIEELSDDGISIIYVSHRLDEILDLCNRVTVFKDGERVNTVDRQSITKSSLIQDIVGGEFVEASKGSAATQNDGVLLEVSNLRREPAVRGVSFVVHRGEILGLAGLVGSGRSELARLIFGADAAEGGEVLLDGKPLRPRGPYDAVKRGVGLVPEERRSQGLVLTKSVAFNLNLSSLRSLRLVKWLPFMDRRRRARRSTDMARRLAIKAPSVRTEVGRLSGGNQQKVVIGKWLTKEARLLLLDEPSRGVDIGARAEIHTIIREIVGRGSGVLVISSEEEELVGLCDRVLVMADGRMVGELSGAEITREAILRLSYAHGEREAEGEAS
ncbi:MAG: sugar ABC transporter ATP-binding protein [Rubrobacteraceae bacterium]